MTTLRSLSNIRTLRAVAREATLEQLEALLEKVSIVIEEKREELKAQAAAEAKRLEDLKKYKEMLEKDGISAEELAVLLGGSQPAERKARAPRPAKYKFIDANGNEKTWTGQGRTPRELVGKNLADYAI